MRVADDIKTQMEAVDELVVLAAKQSDGTEAMKFAQAALNACDAINKKYMCIGANNGYVYANAQTDGG